MDLRGVLIQLCLCVCALAAIVPTTYRPSTYNGTRIRGRELRFVRKDSTSALMNRVNTTYRLFGKTYYIQPDGTRVESSIPYFSSTKSPTEASTLDEQNQTEMLASLSNSIPYLSDDILSQDTNLNDVKSSHGEDEIPQFVSATDETKPATPNTLEEQIQSVTQETTMEPQNEASTEPEIDSGRWTNGKLNFDEVVRTGAMVVQSRGVSTAFLDAVSIIYECVRNHWSSGIVTCLTQRTARLLDAALRGGQGEDLDEVQEDGDLRPRGGELQEDTSQGRKKVFKKLFHPMGMLLRLKFLFVLVAVAVLAGKAAVLSFGSFAMTLMMYMKKPSHSYSHPDLSHVTVYPQSSFHNKRYDDPGVVGGLNGGRDFYMR